MPGSDVTPDLDDEGFLRSIKDWDQAVAKYLADQASIVLILFNTPVITSIPAFLIFCIPLPETLEKVSIQPTTTLGILCFIIKSAHGGVLPK